MWNTCTMVDMKDYAPHWAPQTITSDYSVITIDEMVKNNNIKKIDWMKIDVEGAEVNVINGGLNSIAKFMPNMIIECHTFLNQNFMSEIKQILSQFNYSFEEVARNPCDMLIVRKKNI